MINIVPKRRNLITGRRIYSIVITAITLAAILFAYDRVFAASAYEVRIAALEPVPAAEAGAGLPAFMTSTGIAEAWKLLAKDVVSTIAIVDTGADFNHPELKPYLLNGKNFVQTGKPPQDDNGHGTAVAGIIAAVAKAGEGKWLGKILPIKALDKDGAGDEESLTQGIRYAVEQGADIVVLSLGLRRDAPGLRDAVALAESKGVLLVAAGGNDAAVLGDKATVQYPAAYATVLAVSGSDGLKPERQSTPGVEIDISAAWRVSTLAIGGGTADMEGSSMAAPQAAASAALLKTAHPDWKPVQLREALRQSAAGSAVWNPDVGYGFLSAAKAMTIDGKADWREPNDTRGKAGVFPLGKEVTGTWGTPKDEDWFVVDIPYDGTYAVYGDQVRLNFFTSKGEIKALPGTKSGPIAAWTVGKGRYWLKSTQAVGGSADYRIYSFFTIGPDIWEPNDTAASAFTVPARSQEWTATFHQRGDEDWTQVRLPKDGFLRISASANTARIDLELTVQPAGGAAIVADERGDGANEQITLKQAKAGKYYIRVKNAVSANPDPVIGTYTVVMEYITQYEDFYEPNDDALSATPLQANQTYNGLIASAKDEDWFKFTVEAAQTVTLTLEDIPAAAIANVELRDKKLQTLKTWSSAKGQTALEGKETVMPGTYYLVVKSDRAISDRPYGLKIGFGPVPVQSKFSDLNGHKAAAQIFAIVEAGWAGGYSDGTFRPDQNLTRSEGIAIIVRAFGLKKSSSQMRFTDVPRQNWAYDPISKADAAGWLGRYASGSLQPNRHMTRGEAAVLLAKAAELKLAARPAQVFKDVPAGHWSAAAVEALKRDGWLKGFADANFKPDAAISRAEWSVLLAELLNRRKA